MQPAEGPGFAGTRRFRVLSRLGQGGAGDVYEVLDGERNTRVALKTLHTPDAEGILLLKHEFRSVQDVYHPNLVPFHELFEEDGRWFFTMDYVPGTDFLAYVRHGSSPYGRLGHSNAPGRPVRVPSRQAGAERPVRSRDVVSVTRATYAALTASPVRSPTM
jgi:serine/threonine protein kinase